MKPFTIEPAGRREMPVLANLMQLYLHDLSEYFGEGPDTNGRFDAGIYELYWIDPGHHPFLVRADHRLAGFAFVREVRDASFSMAEFFITRSFRRSGIGTRAARALFDRFRGEWSVAQLERNLPAQRFWRQVIADYTDGRFTETWSETPPRGPTQAFRN